MTVNYEKTINHGGTDYTDFHRGLLHVSLCPQCLRGKNKIKINHLVKV